MDHDRLAGLRARKETAWRQFVAETEETLYRFLYLRLGDPDEARDVAQETYLRAWRAIDRYDPARPIRPWLLGIAANLSKNRYRSASRMKKYLDRWLNLQDTALVQGVSHRLETKQEHTQVVAAVSSLSRQDREVVVLRYFLELPVKECAQALSVAEGTVKSRTSRALRRLQSIIEREYPELAEGWYP